VLALVAVASACHSRPGRVDGLPVLDTRSAPPARDMPADDAARALGLPTLRDTTLPKGARELRVSDWYSMIAGTPVPVMRLIERPGRPAAGQWIWVWTEHRAWPRRYRAIRCTPWTDSTRTCASGGTGAPFDWPAVAARLDELGVWTLRAPCEVDGTYVSDGGELLIQRRAGAEYETYKCNAPAFRRASVPGHPALDVYEYFDQLARRAGGPPPS
jgi:hypothetical protein